MGRLIPLYDPESIEDMATDLSEHIILTTAGGHYATALEPLREVARDLFASGWRKLPEEATAGLEIVENGARVTFEQAARTLQGQDPHHRIPPWDELPENTREWWRAAIVALAAVVGASDSLSTPLPYLAETAGPPATSPPPAPAHALVWDSRSGLNFSGHCYCGEWGLERQIQESAVKASYREHVRVDTGAARPEEWK